MLGKTAGGLYWMFRYLERSENVARLIDAGFRIAMTRSEASADEWRSIIETSGARANFEAAYRDYSGPAVINYLLREPQNPSSVLSAVASARHNARLVRTALTREVWESVNDSWMTLKDALERPVSESALPEALALIRQQSSQVRGALHGTMLRNDVFNFCRLGTFLERLDNIARIVDVKYYVLLPSVSLIGSSLDNVQWQTLLRAASGERAFGWLHGDAAGPLAVAEFLISDRRMPRSLAFCAHNIVENLDHLARDYGKRHAAHDVGEKLLAHIAARPIEEVFEGGLHEFLVETLRLNGSLSMQIETDYQFNR